MKPKQKSNQSQFRKPGPVQPSSRRDVFARIRRSVVAIVNAPVLAPGQNFDPRQIVIAGSGFYVTDDGLVVTAGHVLDKWLPGIQQAQKSGATPDMPAVLSHGPVQQAGSLQVSWGYFLTPATGLFRSGKYDLGLIQTNPVGDIAKAICSVEFAASPCSEGDHIATCGYPFGVDLHAQILGGVVTVIPSFSQGVVSAILPHNAAPASALKRFQIHCMISGGNSGGPVFEPHSGKVVGIVTNSVTNVMKDVVTKTTPVDANGAPTGAPPVEKIVKLEVPVGLALAEHAHHVQTVVAEAGAFGKPVKQAAP